MILATRGRDVAVERREGSWEAFYPPPGANVIGAGGFGWHQRFVSVTAVASAVRLLSGTIGSFVMRTYRGDGPGGRRPVLDSWQAALFQEPGEDESSFLLWEDLVTSIELTGHGMLWKTRTSVGIEELSPIDPDCTMVERDRRTRAKRIWGWIEGERREITDQVIHIRGWSPVAGAVAPTSPLELHRHALSGARAYEEWRGRYFDNDATPGIVLVHPGQPTKPERRDLLRAWVQRHQGPRNAGVPGMVWGGITLETIPSSMRDAQGTEHSEALVRDVARMFIIYPPGLLAAAMTGSVPPAELTSDLFVRFSLLSRMRRIERGLYADRELFPDRSLYPRLDPAEFIRGDIKTTADKHHKLKQVGLETANEGRAELGLPPHPDGDVLQETPVGGAPNQGDQPATEPPQEG